MNMNQSFFVNYLGLLSGAMIRTKNFHWAAKHNDIHARLDEFYKKIDVYADSIAEGYMGILGTMQPNVVTAQFPSTKTPSEMIDFLGDQVENFYDQLPNNSTYAGLKSETDAFIQAIKKYTYLFGRCDQSGYTHNND